LIRSSDSMVLKKLARVAGSDKMSWTQAAPTRDEDSRDQGPSCVHGTRRGSGSLRSPLPQLTQCCASLALRLSSCSPDENLAISIQ
jgi:hypothetical protein